MDSFNASVFYKSNPSSSKFVLFYFHFHFHFIADITKRLVYSTLRISDDQISFEESLFRH